MGEGGGKRLCAVLERKEEEGNGKKREFPGRVWGGERRWRIPRRRAGEFGKGSKYLVCVKACVCGKKEKKRFSVQVEEEEEGRKTIWGKEEPPPPSKKEKELKWKFSRQFLLLLLSTYVETIRVKK